jgi:hypothetical protein
VRNARCGVCPGCGSAEAVALIHYRDRQFLVGESPAEVDETDAHIWASVRVGIRQRLTDRKEYVHAIITGELEVPSNSPYLVSRRPQTKRSRPYCDSARVRQPRGHPAS